jgi:hypothetical protein
MVSPAQATLRVLSRGFVSQSRIDPRRNAVDKTIRVGTEPVDLVAGLGAVGRQANRSLSVRRPVRLEA